MKIAVMPCSSAPGWLKILFGFLMLCLLTSMPAAAQAESLTPFAGSLGSYANLSLIVPTEVVVSPEYLDEVNYSDGRFLVASLSLNESWMLIYLIYPCQPLEGQLDASGLKSFVEDLDPSMNQTVYSPDPLNISDKTAIWGQIGSNILVAYQPSNQTVSMIFIDANVTEDVLEYLLGFYEGVQPIQITVNESSSLLWPGYCEGLEMAEAGAAEAENQTGEVVAAAKAVNETATATETEQVVNETEAAVEPVQAVNQTGSDSSVEQTQAVITDIKGQFKEKFGINV